MIFVKLIKSYGQLCPKVVFQKCEKSGKNGKQVLLCGIKLAFHTSAKACSLSWIKLLMRWTIPVNALWIIEGFRLLAAFCIASFRALMFWGCIFGGWDQIWCLMNPHLKVFLMGIKIFIDIFSLFNEIKYIDYVIKFACHFYCFFGIFGKQLSNITIHSFWSTWRKSKLNTPNFKLFSPLYDGKKN